MDEVEGHITFRFFSIDKARGFYVVDSAAGLLSAIESTTASESFPAHSLVAVKADDRHSYVFGPSGLNNENVHAYKFATENVPTVGRVGDNKCATTPAAANPRGEGCLGFVRDRS